MFVRDWGIPVAIRSMRSKWFSCNYRLDGTYLPELDIKVRQYDRLLMGDLKLKREL
jgi:hypothetical protein